MKRFSLLFCAGVLLAGCSTYQGGTADDYYESGGAYSTYPEPASSPTFRPGMNPDDIRDHTSITRPGAATETGAPNPQWGVPGSPR